MADGSKTQYVHLSIFSCGAHSPAGEDVHVLENQPSDSFESHA